VHDCGDYRGVSLLNVVYKLLSAILNKRLVRYCDENGVLDEEQGGSRQGRRCTDQYTTCIPLLRNVRVVA
jgi:hypothetical protein